MIEVDRISTEVDIPINVYERITREMEEGEVYATSKVCFEITLLVKELAMNHSVPEKWLCARLNRICDMHTRVTAHFARRVYNVGISKGFSLSCRSPGHLFIGMQDVTVEEEE